MSDNSNEITVRILCTKAELIRSLEDAGYRLTSIGTLDDIYFLPGGYDASLTPRKNLEKAVLLRKVTEDGKTITELVHKKKQIAPDGTILSQQKSACEVTDGKQAAELLRSMGYEPHIRIEERNMVYEKDGPGIVIKDVKDLGLLAEIETREGTPFDTIDNLIGLVTDLRIPIVPGEYFVKKAELACETLLRKETWSDG